MPDEGEDVTMNKRLHTYWPHQHILEVNYGVSCFWAVSAAKLHHRQNNMTFNSLDEVQ